MKDLRSESSAFGMFGFGPTLFLPMTTFGCDVQNGRLRDFVFGRNHDGLVKFHQLFDDQNGAFKGCNVGTGVPVFRC